MSHQLICKLNILQLCDKTEQIYLLGMCYKNMWTLCIFLTSFDYHYIIEEHSINCYVVMQAIRIIVLHNILYRGMFLGIYAALGFSQALFVLFASFALALGGIFASKKLHNSMMNSIMRSPMSFFDTTPLGRILNRFSKDVYTIDETIPRSLRGFIMTVFSVVSTIIVILIATPIFAVVIFPLGFLYAFIQVNNNYVIITENIPIVIV